jgi:hypothetical protein
MNTETPQWLKDLAEAKYPYRKIKEDFNVMDSIFNMMQRYRRQGLIAGVQLSMANQWRPPNDYFNKIGFIAGTLMCLRDLYKDDLKPNQLDGIDKALEYYNAISVSEYFTKGAMANRETLNEKSGTNE